MAARWEVHDDADSVTLRVELWNGCRVYLIASKDSTTPGVLLTGPDTGLGLEFDQITHASFRRWLDQAQGRG